MLISGVFFPGRVRIVTKIYDKTHETLQGVCFPAEIIASLKEAAVFPAPVNRAGTACRTLWASLRRLLNSGVLTLPEVADITGNPIRAGTRVAQEFE